MTQTTDGVASARAGSVPLRVGDPEVSTRPGILARVERRAARSPRRLAGRNPALVLARIARRFVEVRLTGLAAEMTYFTALSLFPLLTAVGASLGLLERVLGDDAVTGMEDMVVENLQLVLSQELTDQVVAPLVRDLLRSERVGVAVSGVLVALWLSSRVFRAAIRALDEAYEVEERRTLLQQYALSLLFTLGAVLMITTFLTTVVIGPLLGWGRGIAEEFGAGSAYDLAWSYGRWAVLIAGGVLWHAWVYLVGPNVDNTWRETLPGAVVAVAGLALLSVGFRVYVEVAGPQGPRVETGSEGVLAVTQFVGAALAGLLYAWLANSIVLLGGLVNAELFRTPPRVTRPAGAPGRPGGPSR